MTMIDLSALEEREETSGVPLDIPLNQIIKDPNQPRKEFNLETLQELSDNIKLRGVKQPISVRPNPDRPGAWIINAGERRYKASLLAKLKTIPAFVDEQFSDYDQVTENQQRDNLSPMELALFINKKVLEGEPKISIAKSLSKHQAVISAHLSMIDMPDAINNAYRTGRINTAQTISQLRKLHKQYPQEVEIWLTKIDFVTRGNVDALKKDIIERENNDARAEQDNVKKTISKANDTQPETEKETLTNTDSDNDTGDSTGTSTRSDSLHDHKDPSIKNPYIQIKYDDKIGSLMLDKYPSTPGQMWIRFENGQEMEVGASALHLVSLSEKSN